ncbi:hypothetical protein FOMPIDRAFT_1019308 [Fomitopsis schrenkii]|uniref:F-box domain-containing protein n=1 Tax=Fomitopsis schrenkii TaxID=2126942 RepID=S8DR46_FOMSC|nr:hypothetical protein FOMPIDRAFT_1019308 [Fomitopsis schrenkii]
MLHLPNLQAATLFFTDTRAEKVGLFGNTTSLRRLDLQYTTWLPSNHSPHLTQLHLTNWRADPEVSAFLAFLRQCPNLADVFIGSLFTDDPFPATDTDFVELPRLRRLSLDELYRGDISCILPHIRTPPDIPLVMTVFVSSMNDEDASVILRFSAILSCTTAVFRMECEGPSSMAFLSQTSGVYIEDPLQSAEGSILLSRPLGQVREIWIVDDPTLPAIALGLALDPDIFRRMPAVRRLVVTIGLIRGVTSLIRNSANDTRPVITSFEILVNTPDFQDDEVRTCVASLIEMGMSHPVIMIPSGLPSAQQRIMNMDSIDSTKCLTCEQLPIPVLPDVCSEHSDLGPSWGALVAPLCKLENGSLVPERGRIRQLSKRYCLS